MKVLRKKRVVALLFLAMILILFYNNSWMGRVIYPIKYKSEINAAAELNNLDPLYIAAIIRVESNYQDQATSNKGAIGIMQIMPDTANWLLGKDTRLSKYREEDLYD